MKRLRPWCTAALVLITSVAAAQNDAGIAKLFPAQPSQPVFVTDYAGIIDAEHVGTINELAAATQQSLKADIAVVTLPTIGDYQPYEVATAIGRAWKVGGVGPIGSEYRNLGAVLLLVQKTAEHKGWCWVAPGMGAEGFITDATSGEICDEMIPSLKAGDYSEAALIGAKILHQKFEAHVHPPPPPVPVVIDWGRTLGNLFKILASLVSIGLAVLFGLWFRGLLRAKKDNELLRHENTTLARHNEILEAHIAQLNAELPGHKSMSHADGVRDGKLWGLNLVKKYADEPVRTLLERFNNNGESLAEKARREHREKLERDFKRVLSSFYARLESENATEEEALRLLPEYQRKVNDEIDVQVAHRSLMGQVANWLGEKERRRKAAIAAEEARKRREREEEEEEERYSSSSYGSSSSSWGGGSSGGSTFGGGGGFSGGGGGRSF